MGFVAHLRFHWMETIVYKSLQYIPLAMIGFGITEFFYVHLVMILIGHLNHANLSFPLGPLKFIFNHSAMHIWHHAKNIPNKNGVNFGLSLSIWDYIFKTNYIPTSGRDEELGFEDDDKIPSNLPGQLLWGIKKAPQKKGFNITLNIPIVQY